ncbi:hypothetical protein [Thermoactinomyces mirandus]|uniref:hypothetical protein n=1 Tax=Thermoactinomyces mirandus TaxID=2756294 RepID=UPI0015EF1754|nr:hypothetical protein [Thermoactinomyces mirandus]
MQKQIHPVILLLKQCPFAGILLQHFFRLFLPGPPSCKGELSEDAKYEIMAMLADYFGYNLDEVWEEDSDKI